jgi:IS6 family transposase
MEQLALETKLDLFKWKYLYQAVDTKGKTIDFMLTENRDVPAVKRFFLKALSSPHNQLPREITLDKKPAYLPAIQDLINDKTLPKETLIRQTEVLNNIVEHDHRFIKKITKPMLGFKSCLTAEQTLNGIEAMHMIRKGQVENNSSVLSAVERVTVGITLLWYRSFVI